MKTTVRISIFLWLLAGAVHAAGPMFSTVLSGSGQDYATSVASDAQGNVYVAGLTYSSDFPVTAGAVQTVFGQTCDAFVAKVGPDGKIIWATFLGGILDDWATGVALDSAGNVLVTGWTRSANFPLVNPVQSVLSEGTDYFDAFVAKLDPTGSKLIYSTFLGGQENDGAAGIAVDAAGNAYVAVNTNSTTGYPGAALAPGQYGIFVSKLDPQGALLSSFFHATGTAGGIALDAAGSVYISGTTMADISTNLSDTTQGFLSFGTSQAMVFKITPDGTKKVYEFSLGGSAQASAAGIAVDSAGEAWIAGTTSSVDFPLVKPLQSSTGARPLWKSVDDGTTWTPLDNLPFAIPLAMVVDPANLNTLYEATADLGVFKSLDSGATWTAASSGLAGKDIPALAIDPVHPQTLYAAQSVPVANGGSSSAVYKTTNGAVNWTLIDSPALAVTQLSVDAQNANIVWEIGSSLRKSSDGGATWNPVTFPGPGVVSMALDPRVSGHLFASSSFIFCSFGCGGNVPSLPYLYRSVDGGATWIQIPSVPPSSPLLVDGSTNPSTVYDGLAYRSVDGGITWSAVTPPPGESPTLLSLDHSGAVYASSSQGLFVSRDHGQSWSAVGSSVPPVSSVAGGLVPAGSGGTLYAATNQVATAGFISKLSADGSSILFSTFLDGHASTEGFLEYAAEPGAFETQTWISGIVLDAAGNAAVAGGTRAADFPVANPAQAANAGLADAFATTIAADGGKLNYSTYYGGSQDDGALAVALDTQGNAVFAGQTWSGDFPVPGGPTLPFTYGNAFVVKLPTAPPAVSSVLNGASFQPGIEAGSWVTIKGASLAGSTRTWTAADFVGGNLPTSLDGVSVTIDGQPAFVNYISPTQINVQAPSDSVRGAVNVVVTNNGIASAPGTAQLQAVAPAFFLYLGTGYAIASHLPDYAAVGDPSAPAHPGDTVVLWGTGFGPTTPAVAAGITVSGLPAVTPLPTVTVGGVSVPVISALLTPDSAGLYQITIQLPATLPTGMLAVQATVGGVTTPAGVSLFVGQ
jgi:uncharacterized protein (TIGR03437 family)